MIFQVKSISREIKYLPFRRRKGLTFLQFNIYELLILTFEKASINSVYVMNVTFCRETWRFNYGFNSLDYENTYG